MLLCKTENVCLLSGLQDAMPPLMPAPGAYQPSIRGIQSI